MCLHNVDSMAVHDLRLKSNNDLNVVFIDELQHFTWDFAIVLIWLIHSFVG